MSSKAKQVDSSLPTKWGNFRIATYQSGIEGFPHVVLYHCELPCEDTLNVRIHSECMTGDLFGSVRCDCGAQMDHALDAFGRSNGILVYLRQEGRGIGLVNKLKAYNLQDDEGMDTIKANHALGFHTDERDYAPGIEILKDLGVKSIRLFTNNPDKIDAFDDSGIEVVERVPIDVGAHEKNHHYLKTKKDSMGHMF